MNEMIMVTFSDALTRDSQSLSHSTSVNNPNLPTYDGYIKSQI